MTILDEASAHYGTLAFSGVFNGTLSSKGATLTNTFEWLQVQSMQLGNHLYTVQIGPFAPPGPPTADIAGSISAFVSVSDVPEPYTLILSGLCLALCGAGWWWKRPRAPLQPGPC
jgi:hypothetical protein